MSQTQKVRGVKNVQAGGHIIQNITINISVAKIDNCTPTQTENLPDQK